MCLGGLCEKHWGISVVAVRSMTGRWQLRLRAVRAGSWARRSVLGFLLRFDSKSASDPAALLNRFPDEAMMPLRRNGLDPVPALGELRDRAPVSRLKMPLGLRGWLISGYEESREVLAADPETFSNDFHHMIGKVGIAADQDPGGLGFADPPAHTRLRHMLTAHFTTRALAPRTTRIQQIIDCALDDVATAGADGAVVDLQRLFALAIPSRTIMELLGVDESDSDEFQRMSAERFDFSGGAVGSLNVITESLNYLEGIVARQRVEPRPGLISDILVEYGDAVGDLELAGLVDGVLTGGLETTVSMLALGALKLLEEPSLAVSLRERPGYVEPFVEEMLRYLTVVQVSFPRFARRDVELGGRTILRGDAVVCSLSGANRDPRHGSGLDSVDPERASKAHLAFGHGLHRCVGAELARLELRLAFPALARRFPEMRLAVSPDELRYRDLSIVYGLQELPVVLE